MKKVFLSILVLCFMSCGTAPEEEQVEEIKQEQEKENGFISASDLVCIDMVIPFTEIIFRKDCIDKDKVRYICEPLEESEDVE